MPVDDGYFTSLEVAEMLRVHRTTVLKLIADRRIEAFEVSPRGDKRIMREALIAYMEKQRIPLVFLERYEADSGKKRVLVIEDNRAFALRVAQAIGMEDSRIETRVARTAAEGAVLLGEFRPHLILLDFRLPDMTADRLLESIQEKREEIGSKVILMSTRSKNEVARGEDLEEKLRRLGVEDFIYKFEKVKTIRDAALSALDLGERRVSNRSEDE